jgi:large subunit ribosomal protein L10
VYLRVLKNTLARRAVAGTPFEGSGRPAGRPADLRHFEGSGGCAKVLNDFAKGNDKLVLKAGAMPNFVMDERE